MGFGKPVPVKKGNKTYKLSDWIRASKESKRFHSYKVYIVRCYDENESFFKIGRTFVSIEDRLCKLPYKYEVIEVYEDNPFRIFKLERKLHRLSKEYKYTPIKSFAGQTECFSKINEYEKKE